MPGDVRSLLRRRAKPELGEAPMRQGEKFVPEGIYVRRWVPELARLSAEWIHRPWEAPSSVLEAAKVKLGRSYPLPLVSHDFACRRALGALNSLKEKQRVSVKDQ